MAANKQIRFGPAYLAASVANVVTPGAAPASAVGYTSTAPYVILRHIRITNKTGGAATFTFYVGATGGSAGGTEVIGLATSVAANPAYDWYGSLRLDTADFLTGLASAGSTLTFEAEGEVGLS